MKLSLIVIGVLGCVLYFGGWIPGVGATGHADTDAQLAYWSDGKPKSSITWVDGKREGPASEWYSNGQKREEGEYTGGERCGSWSFWREDGSLDSERSGRYQAGRKLAD